MFTMNTLKEYQESIEKGIETLALNLKDKVINNEIKETAQIEVTVSRDYLNKRPLSKTQQAIRRSYSLADSLYDNFKNFKCKFNYEVVSFEQELDFFYDKLPHYIFMLIQNEGDKVIMQSVKKSIYECLVTFLKDPKKSYYHNPALASTTFLILNIPYSEFRNQGDESDHEQIITDLDFFMNKKFHAVRLGGLRTKMIRFSRPVYRNKSISLEKYYENILS